MLPSLKHQLVSLQRWDSLPRCQGHMTHCARCWSGLFETLKECVSDLCDSLCSDRAWNRAEKQASGKLTSGLVLQFASNKTLFYTYYRWLITFINIAWHCQQDIRKPVWGHGVCLGSAPGYQALPLAPLPCHSSLQVLWWVSPDASSPCVKQWCATCIWASS